MTLTELVPIPCRICKLPVAIELPAEGEFGRDVLEHAARVSAVHDGCYDSKEGRIRAAQILAEERARLENWNRLCPDEFRKKLNWKRESCNRTNYEKVMSWKFGEQNLLVRGPSGTCKTRFVWKLLEREWKAHRTIAAHTHAGLRMTLTALASSEQARCNALVEQLAAAQILFIDDLGKGRATPASEEAFFALLDARVRSCRPVLFTTDLKLRALDQVWTDNYSVGTMRRIFNEDGRCLQIEF